MEDKTLEKLTGLTTAVISVFLAISGILGGNASDDMLVYRGKANDYWNYFQAKSIKGGLYEVNRKIVEAEMANPANAAAYNAAMGEKLKDFDAKIAKYEKEKEEIKAQAEDYEKLHEEAAAKENVYDYAEGLYQVAIVLAAISLISGTRYLWIMSCILGGAGIAVSAWACFVA